MKRCLYLFHVFQNTKCIHPFNFVTCVTLYICVRVCDLWCVSVCVALLLECTLEPVSLPAGLPWQQGRGGRRAGEEGKGVQAARARAGGEVGVREVAGRQGPPPRPVSSSTMAEILYTSQTLKGIFQYFSLKKESWGRNVVSLESPCIMECIELIFSVNQY